MPTTTAPMSFEDWKAGQGGSQAAPAPAPAAGKPEMSFEDWKASQSAGPAPKAPAKPYSLGKDVLMSVGALADMSAGFVGDVIGRGLGTGVFALIGALKEDDQEAVWKAATAFGADMAEANPLAHPVKSIMKWATGDDSGSYEESTVSSVFNKVGGFLQKGGAHVEKETKGAVRAEAVDALLGQITNLAMMKGGEALWTKAGLGKSEAASEKAPSGPQVGGVAAEAIAKDLAAKPGGEPPKIPMGEGMEEGVRPPSPHGETMEERAARGAAAAAADGISHDEHPGEAPPAQGYYGERTTPPIEDGQVPYSKPGEHTVDDLVPEPKLPGEPKPNWTENFSLEKAGQVSDAIQATADNMNAASGDPYLASVAPHAPELRPNMYGRASPALMTVMGATVVGAMLDQEDPYTGALFGLAAGALLSKGIGALPHQAVEMAKLGEEFWKPDFHAMLDPKYLGRALQWTKAATGADTTVLWQHLKNARKSGVTEQMDREFRNVSEDPALKASLSPEKAKLYDQYVGALREAMAAQLNKIKDPLERKIVAEEIETRAAKNHRAWWEAVSDPSEGIGPRGFQKTASATKSRTVFALEDGTIITTKRVAGGVGPSGAQLPGSWKVTAWKDNVRTDLGYSSEHLKPGTEFNGVKVKSAKQIDIEKHTPIRYVDSDIATHSLKLSELMKYVREKELIDGLLESPGAKGLFVNEKYGQIPEGFVQPQGSMSVPSLKGIFMPKEYAEVFTDFIKKNQGTANLLEGAKNIMIRSMMLNPYAHIMNEMVHWYDSRGLSGFLTPTGVGKYGASKGLYGMAATMPGAIRSVILQDKFQIELQKSGGMLLFPSVKNQMAWNNILQIGLRDAAKTGSFKEMATALATSPARLAKRISDMGSSLMWATRDIMYSQLIKEQMLMGKDMRESIAEVGKHMPEYYIPSRVISDGPAGRIASKILQSPLLVFSPYHYGMVKAVKEIGKDIASGQAEHMVAGMDRAAAIIAGLAVVYPLLDQLNAQMSGQDIAKQRRAGIYHLISGAGEVFDGKKDPSSLITSMLTPNPAPVAAFEILQNHYLWSGQPIRHEGSSMKAQAVDTVKHLASKLAPAQAAAEIHEGKKSWEQYALQQLDIQAKTNAQAARTEEARLRRVKAGTTYGKKVEKTYGVDE